MKELLIVSAGSFLGGGLRFLVSCALRQHAGGDSPLGTLTVNVLGCLLIGFLSALPWNGGAASAHARLFLATGFCGGFTTFSTFMNENAALAAADSIVPLALYAFASLALGFAAVLLGGSLARLI